MEPLEGWTKLPMVEAWKWDERRPQLLPCYVFNDHTATTSSGFMTTIISVLCISCFCRQGKQHQGLSHSPKTRTTGFSVASGQGSPSDSTGPNRWFKPDVDTPSSLRSIQIEERAMKDLKRFYSSVKIVKNQS